MKLMKLFLAVWRFFFSKKEVAALDGHPYRSAAVMPQEVLPKINIKKPRKEFKFNMKLSKMTRVFLHLIPLAMCAVGVGMIYDTSALTLGLKWGTAISVAILGAFCFVLMIHVAEEKAK